MSRLGFTVLICSMGLVACARAPRTDRLFVGGIVHTDGQAKPLAIAVAEGRIVALVTPDLEAPWRRASAEVIDLAGAHVYPGFTESHGHFIGYGAALEQVDLQGAKSFAEVVERVRAVAVTTPAGSWVRGRGWDENLWAEKRSPTHQTLSAAIPDHPVLLRRIDGHAVLTNARGLVAAGIERRTPNPSGGRIVRDAAGEPTGVLVDGATVLLDRVVPPSTDADIERQIALAGRHLAELGLTEIHNAGCSRAELGVLRRLQAAGRLPLRVYAMLDDSDEQLDAELPNGPAVSHDGMLAVRAVKLYADGALGSRGALLSAPYSDEPGTQGLAVTSAERLAAVVRRAGQAGFQPCIHAIGDAAVTRALDIYERELGPRAQLLRPRIEHAQIVRPSDLPRFGSLGVIAAVQPTQCTSDMPWVPARIGEARVPWAYRWRSLLAVSARLSLGSDVPMESPDPRLGIWAAVTRRPPQGTQPGWNLPEALTVAEAIAGYTQWGAYAGFEEGWRGAIAPSFAADLTIFDRDLAVDPEAAILHAQIVRTVVAGRDTFLGGSPR